MADYNVQFSDGRNYLEYEGDTAFVTKALMDADTIVIGTPILAYMKAQIVQTYVFIEDQDYVKKEIVNDDVFLRIERLVEDTANLTATYKLIRKQQEDQYDF